MTPEEQTGEVLNDAAYTRVLNMKEKYNCEIEFMPIADYQEAHNMVMQAALTGDESFDFALLRGRKFSSIMADGYLTDLSTVPHIDYDKPWWDANFRDAFTFNKKQFAAIGYNTVNHMNSVMMVCFNKAILEDYGLESPYDLVNDGKWTFDTAIGMAKTVARDLNGDTVMTADDLWGMTYTCDTLLGILNACGIKICGIDGDGLLEITLNSPRNIDRMQEILVKLFDESFAVDTVARPPQGKTVGDTDFFANGNSLFVFTAAHTVGALRQTDVEFGLLPYPKYSESDEYSSATSGEFNLYTVIPASVSDLDSVGYFLEAFAYEGYKLLKPAYYDNILMGKLTRDDESAETLDYIYGNIGYDTGALMSFATIPTSIGGMSTGQDTDVASFMASILPSAEAEAEKFNKFITE